MASTKDMVRFPGGFSCGAKASGLEGEGQYGRGTRVLLPSPLVGEGGARSAPDNGSLSAETDPSPGFISLRSIAPPSPTRGEGKNAQSSFASMPRLMAGRALSVSYQRLTLGKSASSTLWRGWRQAQPRMAKSATDNGPATNSRPARRLLSTS